VSPDGEFIAYAEVVGNDSVRIIAAELNSKADNRFTIRRPPRAVPRDVGDSLLDGRLRGAPPELRAQLAKLESPRWYPPFRKVLAGLDRTVWLEVSIASAANAVWLGVDARGRVIGELALPRGSTLHAISATQAWTSAEDADGAIRLVRYRIER
jgi:hypothetical protein